MTSRRPLADGSMPALSLARLLDGRANARTFRKPLLIRLFTNAGPINPVAPVTRTGSSVPTIQQLSVIAAPAGTEGGVTIVCPSPPVGKSALRQRGSSDR